MASHFPLKSLSQFCYYYYCGCLYSCLVITHRLHQAWTFRYTHTMILYAIFMDTHNRALWIWITQRPLSVKNMLPHVVSVNLSPVHCGHITHNSLFTSYNERAFWNRLFQNTHLRCCQRALTLSSLHWLSNPILEFNPKSYQNERNQWV